MSVAPFARAAFANGYARYGTFPVSEAAQAACLAAIEAAVATGDEPGLLIAVSESGRAEGLKALIVSRHKAQRKLAGAAIARLCKRLAHATHHDVSLMANAGIVPESVTLDESEKAIRGAAIKGVAIAMLLRLLDEDRGLIDEWDALNTAWAVAATAEGITEAEGMLKVAAGESLPDLDELYAQTIAALRDLGDTWGGQDSWLSDQIQGIAGDLGRALSDALEAGATQQQLLEVTNTVIGEGAGAQFYLDEAMHQAMMSAKVATFSDAGSLIDYVAVMDANTCPTCEDYDEGSPYDPAACPTPPIHGGCRCDLEPYGAL